MFKLLKAMFEKQALYLIALCIGDSSSILALLFLAF